MKNLAIQWANDYSDSESLIFNTDEEKLLIEISQAQPQLLERKRKRRQEILRKGLERKLESGKEWLARDCYNSAYNLFHLSHADIDNLSDEKKTALMNILVERSETIMKRYKTIVTGLTPLSLIAGYFVGGFPVSLLVGLVAVAIFGAFYPMQSGDCYRAFKDIKRLCREMGIEVRYPIELLGEKNKAKLPKPTKPYELGPVIAEPDKT